MDGFVCNVYSNTAKNVLKNIADISYEYGDDHEIIGEDEACHVTCKAITKTYLCDKVKGTCNPNTNFYKTAEPICYSRDTANLITASGLAELENRSLELERKEMTDLMNKYRQQYAQLPADTAKAIIQPKKRMPNK